jgi:Tfp pilus assembly protein PilV
MDRLPTHTSEKQAKEAEMDTIKSVLSNNQYKLTHSHRKPAKDNKSKYKGNNNKKWATFTYIGCKVKTITKLFKDTNINIA